ncbi:MAG: protein kinase [Planctomycetes bacterium]|nr:protein kinase [Planctomycetota bacterium]
MDEPDPRPTRPVAKLVDALELWLDHRSDPDHDDDELLRRHPELRELLEPLVRDELTQADDAPESKPRMLGEFRIVRELGRGGTGIVYEAIQETLGRRVALKVLVEPLAAHPQVVARFRRESTLLARLSHPHVVPVFEAGTQDGVPYHAMELIDGCTLADLLAWLTTQRETSGGGMPGLGEGLRSLLRDPGAGRLLDGGSHVDASLRCLLPIAEALVAAHAHGILHRDVKPANVLVRRNGTTLLSDFGLARDAGDPGLTRSGEFAGTPQYVSPEQASGGTTRLDQRTDVFSFAVTLYELLLLERPFDGDTTDQVLERVRVAEPPALRRRGGPLPEDLACVLDKALRKAPDDRYATMAEFADELRAVRELRPVRARRRGPVSRVMQAVRRSPLRALLVAALGVGLPALAALAIYVGWQQPRIAAAAAAERLPAVERLLETVLLEEDFAARGTGIAAAREAYALRADLPETIAALLSCELALGHRAAAAELMQRLRETAPDVADQFAPELPTVEPATALAWFVRGMRLLDAGHDSGDVAAFTAAAHAMRRAIDRADAPRSMFHGQYLHALLHLRDGARIRELAADLRHRWPRSPFAAYWCGFALQEHDAERAAEELRRAIELAPEVPQPWLRLGKLHEMSGDFAEAERLYRRAGALAAASHLPRLGLARVLLATKHRDAALVEAEAAVRIAPESHSARQVLGQALAALGRPVEARREFDAAIERGPAAASTWLARARFEQDRGDLKAALADAERAAALEPELWPTHTMRGTLRLFLGQPGEAATAFVRALELKPDHAAAWCSLAQARRRMGDLDAAHAALSEALRLDPSIGQAQIELGKTLRAQRRNDEARDAFLAAIERGSSVAEARVNLAGLAAEAGDLEAALVELERARRVDPSLREAWLPAFGFLEQLGRVDEAQQLRAAYAERRELSSR